MQRIDDVGVQAFVKQKSKNVVAVVSGSLKPYFYFISWTDAAANSLQQCVKALCIVLNGEYIRQFLLQGLPGQGLNLLLLPAAVL